MKRRREIETRLRSKRAELITSDASRRPRAALIRAIFPRSSRIAEGGRGEGGGVYATRTLDRIIFTRP